MFSATVAPDVAGMNVDDELIALDGYRLSPDTWPGHLEMFEPAQELELLVSRRGKIVPLKITLEETSAQLGASRRCGSYLSCETPPGCLVRSLVPNLSGTSFQLVNL